MDVEDLAGAEDGTGAARAVAAELRILDGLLSDRVSDEVPVAEPTTWLARVGWKKSRFGLLTLSEMPVVAH